MDFNRERYAPYLLGRLPWTSLVALHTCWGGYHELHLWHFILVGTITMNLTCGTPYLLGRLPWTSLVANWLSYSATTYIGGYHALNCMYGGCAGNMHYIACMEETFSLWQKHSTHPPDHLVRRKLFTDLNIWRRRYAERRSHLKNTCKANFVLALSLLETSLCSAAMVKSCHLIFTRINTLKGYFSYKFNFHNKPQFPDFFIWRDSCSALDIFNFLYFEPFHQLRKL